MYNFYIHKNLHILALYITHITLLPINLFATCAVKYVLNIVYYSGKLHKSINKEYVEANLIRSDQWENFIPLTIIVTYHCNYIFGMY